MTVHRKTYRLKMTQEQAERYIPPVGVDVIWHEWDPIDRTVVAEVITSDLYPDPTMRKTGKDIDVVATETLQVVQDSLPRYPRSPKIAKRVEAMMDDPRLQTIHPSRLRNARDSHTVQYTSKQYDQLNKVMQSSHVRAIQALGTTENVTRRFGEVERKQTLYSFKVSEIDSG